MDRPASGPEPVERRATELPRITTRRLMVAVFVAGLCLAACRVNPALGCLVTAISCLTLLRIFGEIDRNQSQGHSMPAARLVRTSLASVLVSSTILVLSLLPALCLFPFFNLPHMHETPSIRPDNIVGIVICALVTIPIASLLRRRLW